MRIHRKVNGHFQSFTFFLLSNEANTKENKQTNKQQYQLKPFKNGVGDRIRTFRGPYFSKSNDSEAQIITRGPESYMDIYRFVMRLRRDENNERSASSSEREFAFIKRTSFPSRTGRVRELCSSS